MSKRTPRVGEYSRGRLRVLLPKGRVCIVPGAWSVYFFLQKRSSSTDDRTGSSRRALPPTRRDDDDPLIENREALPAPF